ncbi:MAG: hypothetical protein JRK53_20070 [Deltaproteobacteria bacterium]|nr:hypothetical protein [Deltaproteobacteria bacterium]
MIERTVSAALAIHYENKKIYVLDDCADDAVQGLCDSLKAFYIRRPSHVAKSRFCPDGTELQGS